MIPNRKAILKKYGKRKGRVMFPTSHDITEISLDDCITVLRKLLEAGNNVLITTKPYLKEMKAIHKNLSEFGDQIKFRFTVTSMYDDILSFFEPNAPKYEERLKALEYADLKDYKTSISIEPYLDRYPSILADSLMNYTNGSIWIGLMSNMNNMIKYCLIEARDISNNFEIINDKVLKIVDNIGYILSIYSKRAISRAITYIKDIQHYSKRIKLKDSIRNFRI